MKLKLHSGMELTESEIDENYQYFIDFLKNSFSGERLDGLLSMYDENNLGMQLALAPASTRLNFHCAWPGGYIQHVLHVEKASRGVQKLYAGINGTVDFTDEERIFAALHHDLGKLGDETGPQYVRNDSDWHVKNRGEIYKMNPALQYMRVPDRALYILQQYNVKVTWKETLGIKLADGLYDPACEEYFMSHNPDRNLKTNLPYIIHVSDLLSCRAESDEWKAHTTGDTGTEI
jgi:hypothetical protein